MNSGKYFFDDSKSRKFWSYALDGKKQTIRHGRIGTEGRETTKTFPTAAAAEAATAKLVNQKIRKGYIQVDPSKLKFHPDKKGKRPATKAQVARLEKRLNAKLPADYKDFLLTQNGGFSEGSYISVPMPPRNRRLPRDLKVTSVGVGEIYSLSDEAKGFGVLWGINKVLPRLPKGHLPIAGWLDFFSLSLDENAGCVYLWDEYAAECREFNEVGKVIFNSAHGLLVAGSFNEFLSRIALHQEQAEAKEQAAASTQADDRGMPQKQGSRQNAAAAGFLESKVRDDLPLSKRRQVEILRLTYEGGDELTAAIAQGEKFAAKFLRQVRREISDFLKTTKSKDELHFFAENWHWDCNAGVKPLLELLKNPHVDAGTLMQLFWHACAEDYYLIYSTEADAPDDLERDIFRVLRQIERRVVNADYKTAAFPFDPTPHISMSDRRPEFARPIPDVMYQPISGRMHRA